MNAREHILAGLRASLGRAERGDANLSLGAARGPRPALPASQEALLARFQSKAEGLASSVVRVSGRSELPGAVAAYLEERGLPMEAVCWKAYAHLDWGRPGLTLAARPAQGSDLVGITGVFCAVAETGTLVLLSGPDTPAATSLLPETHIAIVPASRVLPAMEDAWDLIRAEQGALPRAVNFVSGPSRTGDIEQTMVLGAHGPYRVHIILLEDRAIA